MGGTGYAEAVEIVFDPKKVSYDTLLDIFWHNIDPTDAGGQFCDRGKQYRTGVFTHTEEQKRLAEQSKMALEKAKPFKFVTAVIPATKFYPAEDYHQDYAQKNPVRYKYYRWRCGRDDRLMELWGKPPGGQ